MEALKMDFRSGFRLILWAGCAAALILTTISMGCMPGSGEYFWGDGQPVLDLGVPGPFDKTSGSFEGEWKLSGARPSTPSPLHIHWNRRSDGRQIELFYSLSDRRLRSLTGDLRSGKVSTIESKAGELTLKVRGWSSMSSIMSGTWHFDPDSAYARQTVELLRSKPDESQWLQLLFAEVDTWYMSALYDATVEKPTVEELLQARWNGVSEDYLKDISWTGARFHPEDIIRLRQHGVPADFLASAVAVDRQFTVDQLIQLHQQGVPSDFLESVRWTDPMIAVNKIVKMRQQGVPKEFFATAKKIDSQLTVDEIVQMRQQGVTADFLADIKHIEPRCSTKDIIRLRQQGVTADFLRKIEESGGQYSIDDVIRLRQQGVDGNYVKALNVSGRPPLDADTIIHLRQRGVDAETARKLRE